MNKVFLLFTVVGLSLSVMSCKKADHHEHDHAASEPVEENPNKALYDEVMDIHDEGMRHADELIMLQEELKKKIASTPDLVEEHEKALELKISRLDSAYRNMMVWMRTFKPDSLNREYLESEMEKIKKVKNDIDDAIARAKEE